MSAKLEYIGMGKIHRAAWALCVMSVLILAMVCTGCGQKDTIDQLEEQDPNMRAQQLEQQASNARQSAGGRGGRGGGMTTAQGPRMGGRPR